LFLVPIFVYAEDLNLVENAKSAILIEIKPTRVPQTLDYG